MAGANDLTFQSVFSLPHHNIDYSQELLQLDHCQYHMVDFT